MPPVNCTASSAVDHGAREYFAVICSECGNQAQVPFKPRMDRPVYCSDCFRKIKPD
jgi:CxxC-x17-CxxC domain-containing protein